MADSKAQATMGDFMIGFLLFMIVIILVSKSLFTHMSADDYQDLQREAFIISESLVGPGYPDNWSNDTVVKIGISTDYRLNTSKLTEFKAVSYGQSQSYFGVKNDYLFFFQRGNTTLNIMGCTFGHTMMQMGGECVVDLDQIEYDDLAIVKRLLIYNSTIIEMVVYVW